jgi:hypothetical protein
MLPVEPPLDAALTERRPDELIRRIGDGVQAYESAAALATRAPGRRSAWPVNRLASIPNEIFPSFPVRSRHRDGRPERP